MLYNLDVAEILQRFTMNNTYETKYISYYKKDAENQWSNTNCSKYIVNIKHKHLYTCQDLVPYPML